MDETKGNLDAPLDTGAEVMPGGVLTVRGWVLFDRLPLDRVEVFVGDEPARSMRRGLPRPDLDRSLVGSPSAIGAGFSGQVVIPRRAAGTSLPVRVRAYSEHGDTWHSPTVHVSVTAEPPLLDHRLVVGGTREVPVRHRAASEGRPLRICAFTHSLHLGGGELYLDELLTRLSSTYGVDITLVSPTLGPLAEGLADKGIDLHVTRPYAVHPLHYEGAVAETQALLNELQPDAVLANTLGLFPAVDAALRQGRPVVWAIHESFEIEDFIALNWGSRGLHDDIEQRMRSALRGAHTIFEAEPTLDLFLRQVPELQGRHVHYGIDLEAIAKYRRAHDRNELRAEAGFAPDEFILLSMGVFQERKAQLAQVLAFSALALSFPRSRLVLVGEHPTEYAGSVREAVQLLGLQSRVDILPIHPDVYRWYEMADVLVNSSDIESLPRSILEAKAFGLPTLATDVFGLPEIIMDGVNGWLCRTNSGNALAAGLYRVLSTAPEVHAAMRENCLAEAPSFDGAGYAEAYHRLLSQLARTHALYATTGATA